MDHLAWSTHKKNNTLKKIGKGILFCRLFLFKHAFKEIKAGLYTILEKAVHVQLMHRCDVTGYAN